MCAEVEIQWYGLLYVNYFWSSLESMFRKGESIMAIESWVRALNRGGKVIELREKDYWKQILKGSHSLHLLLQRVLPHSFSESSRQTSMVQTKSIFQGNQGSKRTMPKTTESATGRTWMSPQVSLTENGLLSYNKNSTSVSPKSHTEFPEQLPPLCNSFFLFCWWILIKLLIMMCASSTWCYRGFMAAFSFRASCTLTINGLISKASIILVGEVFSYFQGTRSQSGTKKKEKS